MTDRLTSSEKHWQSRAGATMSDADYAASWRDTKHSEWRRVGHARDVSEADARVAAIADRAHADGVHQERAAAAADRARIAARLYANSIFTTGAAEGY